MLTPSQLDDIQEAIEAGIESFDFSDNDNYSIEYGRYAKRSRSGQDAIMVKSKSGGWKMPTQYAGVEENNFITRAFEGRESEISKIISKHVKSKI